MVCDVCHVRAGVLIVPLLSWHHQGFDTEPDIAGWSGIPRAEHVMCVSRPPERARAAASSRVAVTLRGESAHTREGCPPPRHATRAIVLYHSSSINVG